MYSLRYGTVPIVRKTGGLADTVNGFDSSNQNGNGFSFKEFSSEPLLKEIQQALILLRKKTTGEK